MTCCTYPGPHLHYPDWLRTLPVVASCKLCVLNGEYECSHGRRLTLTQLLIAWEAGR